MNKEIEISPRQIAKAINDLLDEKEKLEQENKELEEYITYWQKETDKRQDKIDKAIEYLETNGYGYDCCGDMCYFLDEDNLKDLLEILKDIDVDE